MFDSILEKMAGELLKPGGLTLVVTGAGISLASGIPTFRGEDEDAIWSKDVLEMGTLKFFEENPVESLRWYFSRFDKIEQAKPNEAHLALAELGRLVPSMRVITQNIDGLHKVAGQDSLIEVHGSRNKLRCMKSSCINGGVKGSIETSEVDVKAFRENPSEDTLPRCPACGSLLRAHVLWFDEDYFSHVDYQWDLIMTAVWKMTSVIFIGTSNSVGVTQFILDHASFQDLPVFNINPLDQIERSTVYNINAEASEFLPKLLKKVAET